MGAKWSKIITSGSDASLNSVNLGTGTYEGFFDTFTPTTTLQSAINEISLAIGDLVPPKAGVLTGTNLDKQAYNTPITFTAQLAGGLESTHWNGLNPHESNTNFTKERDVKLESTNETGIFRAGKYTDLINDTLEGGITASRSYQNADFEVIDEVNLSQGNNQSGDNGIIKITKLQQFGGVTSPWIIANARITQNITTNDTGSYRYKMKADNGAGESNVKQFYYVGNITPFPTPNISNNGTDITVSNESIVHLSGIEYYGEGTTFTTTGVEVDNLFNPIYTTGNQGTFASNFTNGISRNISEPNHDSSYNKDFSISISEDVSNDSLNASTGTLNFYKPGRTTQTITKTLGTKGINSKGIVSTDNEAAGTFNVEEFYDEHKRKTDKNGNVSWDSTAALSAGELAVVNGKLHFSSKLNSGFTGNQHYFRKFTPDSTKNSGFIQWTPNDSTLRNLSLGDNTSGTLKMVLHIFGDDNIYDLGRVVDQNSGNYIGIVSSKTTSNNTNDSNGLTFSLPANTFTTSTNYMVLQITYKDINTSDNISLLKLKF